MCAALCSRTFLQPWTACPGGVAASQKCVTMQNVPSSDRSSVSMMMDQNRRQWLGVNVAHRSESTIKINSVINIQTVMS